MLFNLSYIHTIKPQNHDTANFFWHPPGYMIIQPPSTESGMTFCCHFPFCTAVCPGVCPAVCFPLSFSMITEYLSTS
jgi:hypothetical protein